MSAAIAALPRKITDALMSHQAPGLEPSTFAAILAIAQQKDVGPQSNIGKQ